jgi:salicylate hydroxylase
MAEVLIAGAGLGGLAAALALIQRGHAVGVFEQATKLREVGAGVQLGANGTRILIALGLEAAMQQVVCAATSKEIRLGTTVQCWPTFDLGETSVERFGAPYWMVHRGDFHRCCWMPCVRPVLRRCVPATAALASNRRRIASRCILPVVNRPPAMC